VQNKGWGGGGGEFMEFGHTPQINKKMRHFNTLTISERGKNPVSENLLQSTLRKKMARAYKNTKKNCKSFKLDNSNAVSVGMTAIKPYLSICLEGLVWFARYCGKMYSRYLFSYGGFASPLPMLLAASRF